MLATTISRLVPLRRGLGMLAKTRHILSLRRERKRLALLDDHLLRDLGLTKREAEEEASRAMWDVPHHWRH